ncbi:MAG: MarR family transcriptional regulator, partial [Ilumatobacteraceae bacterium]|nr:MarR family transcriptional regulator [Ilumatobacteraceae bacterium]
VRVSELAQFLGVDTSTMSRHVKTLEGGGLVVRAEDPLDGRAAHVGLTGHLPVGRTGVMTLEGTAVPT